MADSTLQQIMTTVRRIARKPSPSSMTDAQIQQYINTFVLYDFPQNLRLANLRTTLTFYTQPNVDVYGDTTDVSSTLYDFNNKYTAIHAPVYMAGISAYYTQNRNDFYTVFPNVSYVTPTGLFGDGALTSFSGILNQVPMLQNNVIFTAVDANGTSMVLVDYPANNVSGNFGLPNITPTLPSPYGGINYLTGVFTVNFPNPVGSGLAINAETVPYVAGIPTSMLFYDNQFTIRPVPLMTYPIQVEVDMIPTEFLSTTQNPLVNQWWQYIALGACMAIWRDQGDTASMADYQPIYDQQERRVLRSTLEIRTNQQAPTIYNMPLNKYFSLLDNIQWPY